MKKLSKLHTLPLTLIACIFLAGSFFVTNENTYASSGHSSVKDRAMEANQPFDNSQIDTVHPLPLKTVQAKEDYQGGTFHVLTRKDKIGRFQCSKCHNEKKVPVQKGAELAHGEITINHGQDYDSLSCQVCHHEKERDYLVDEEGRKIDYDHSYQLCGQCHFRQKKDWIGGAHGKRVKYWAGKRVVYNCATCHNPHSPRFEKRWPATYSLPNE